MKALAVHLKSLFQCPSMWFWHAIGLLFLLETVIRPVVDPGVEEGMFMRFLMVSFWAGVVTASVIREPLSKPFAFCMPGHRRTARATLFLVGGSVNAALAVVVLAHPGPTGAGAAVAYLSAATLGMALYLLVVLLVFSIQNAVAIWGIPVALLWLTNKLFTGFLVGVEEVVLYRPLQNSAACLVLAACLAWRLGNRRSARAMCGRTFLPMQYLWNLSAVNRFNVLRKIEGLDRQSRTMWQAIESHFLSRIRRSANRPARRHAVATRYAILGTILPGSLGACVTWLFFVAALLAALGYVEVDSDLSFANVCYYIPVLIGMTLPIRARTSMLLPAGRIERFRACLSIALAGAGAAVLATAAMYGVSLGVGRLLPEITLAGRTLQHHHAEPGLILFPLLPLPLLYICQVLFPRRAQIPQTLVLILTLLLIMAAPRALAGIPAALFAAMLVLSWWCFVGSLHHFCRHGDLAVQ